MNTPDMTKTGDHVRQGDVLIVRRNAKPRGVELLPREGGAVVLAHGEVTGHMHRLMGPQVAMFRDTAGGYLTVKDFAEPLVHEEHDAIVIPPGDYELGLQVEYEPAALRAVAD